jgi:hypothetical protein
MTNFSKRKKGESATDVLPLPIGTNQKLRYRRVQNDFERSGLESLHVWTRERIEALLDEAEKFLETKAV